MSFSSCRTDLADSRPGHLTRPRVALASLPGMRSVQAAPIICTLKRFGSGHQPPRAARWTPRARSGRASDDGVLGVNHDCDRDSARVHDELTVQGEHVARLHNYRDCLAGRQRARRRKDAQLVDSGPRLGDGPGHWAVRGPQGEGAAARRGQDNRGRGYGQRSLRRWRGGGAGAAGRRRGRAWRRAGRGGPGQGAGGGFGACSPTRPDAFGAAGCQCCSGWRWTSRRCWCSAPIRCRTPLRRGGDPGLRWPGLSRPARRR